MLLGLAALATALAAATGGCSKSGSTGTTAAGGGNATGAGTGTGGANTGSAMTSSATGGCTAGCPMGMVCAGSACVQGCDANTPCAMGMNCCSGACIDLNKDPDNCGMCGNACPKPLHAAVTCNGTCQIGGCDTGFFDCDGNKANGCESATTCSCMPGSTQACYEGPAGTMGVGICKPGSRTCNVSGDGYGPCEGQVLPEQETCSDGMDHNCDGTPNNVVDQDGDGWTVCDGDCDDTNPLVNPGAYEIAGDGIDNDCDPTTPDVAPPTCSTAVKYAGVTGMDMAAAMDICNYSGGVQTTTANPPIAMKKWGVISATQVFADGTTPTGADLTNIQNQQDSVMLKFGTGGIVPKKNQTLAVISSGKARDEAGPGWVTPITGTAFNSSIAFSAATAGPLGTYINAPGANLLPGSCAGAACPVGTGANDSTDVRLVIRVPTNAKSFAYNFRFFSAEYQSFQCTIFNDYYLAMLQSAAPGIPADHQISFDAMNNAVSVNNGFFQDCGGNGKMCGTCPFGTAALAGTGFETVNGGSTEWLETDAPVVPGETMTLDLMVFDVGDHIYDTLVLLDNFRWSPATSTVNTHT